MAIRTYDPKKFNFSVGGIPLSSGAAPDTFIKAERQTDGFSDEVGASGEVVRVKSNDHRGTVTYTAMASSQVNDALAAIAASDELLGNGVVPLHGSELNGTTVIAAAEAWVMKQPDVERGKDAGTVEWKIRCADLETFSGGLLS